MKSTALTAIAITGVIGLSGPALAQSDSTEALLRRLEAKVEALSQQNDTLSKQNAALGERVRKMESRPAGAKPATTAEQAADPNLSQAARAAHATYMPVKGGPAAPYRAPCGSFGGWYAGVNGGANYYTNDWKDRDNLAFGVFAIDHAADDSNSKGGWNAGGQIGWNYQSSCTVWGVVADLNWASSKISQDYLDFPTAGQQSLSYSSALKWFGTARARAGVVIDNLLLYATGGLAYAKFDRTLTYTDPGAPFALVLSDSNTKIGFAAGVGTEWNLGNNWTFGSEFLYMGFKRDDATFACTGCPGGAAGLPFRFGFNDAVWVTRVNLNYRFGDYGKGPVVAKY